MKDESRLIFIPRNTAEVKEYRVSRIKVITFASIFLILVTFLGKVGLDMMIDFSQNSKIKTLERTNAVLTSRLSEAKSRIDSLNHYVDVIAEKDEELRIVLGLPTLSQDVRDVGIGGADFVYNLNDEVSGFEDNVGLGDQLNRIAKLEREINLEMTSYKELLNAFHKKQDSIKHVPALKPVIDGRISSSFGSRNHPLYKVRKHHEGLDLAAKIGTPVYAAADGVVKFVGWNGGYGKVVKLNHKYGFETYYGHLNKWVVRNGQKVKRGQKIAEVGNTGNSTGPHLHYEVRLNGKAKNPRGFYFEDKELNTLVVNKK